MYQHTWAEINLDALEHNIKEITSVADPSNVMGVVKANAYGHGAGAVAEALEKAGIKYFAVSNVYEALDLRFAGIKGNILILGNVDTSALDELVKNNITVCVYDVDYAKKLSAAAKNKGLKINCHIKVDTGMGRLGLNLRQGENDEIKADLKELFAIENLNIMGIFTHFPSADTDGDESYEYTKNQYVRFLWLRQEVKKYCGEEKILFHCSNSAATLLGSKDMPSDLYRAGIILYGLTPAAGLKLPINLKPVMTLKSTVSQVKTLNKGDSVSYGRVFMAETQMKVATVSVGYADGLFRSNSQKGRVLINGKYAPILGRVCMDQVVVDVTDIAVQNGDTAVIFGEGLPAEEVAENIGTINYELVCAVAHRVPRVYIKNGRQTKVLRYRSI